MPHPQVSCPWRVVAGADLRSAVEAVLAGKSVDKQTPSIGCRCVAKCLIPAAVPSFAIKPNVTATTEHCLGSLSL